MDDRLLLVVPSATSFRTFLQEVAVAWRDTGRAVAVATSAELRGSTPYEWPHGVERLHLPELRGGSPSRLLSAARALGAHVRRWRPSLIHAHFTAAAAVLAITRLPAGVLRLATFHGLHMTAGRGAGSLPAYLAEGFAIRRMDRAWVLNIEDEEYLGRYGLGNRVARLASCGVGCDLARFDPSRVTASEQHTLRHSLGIAPTCDVVTFVGRRTEFKGFATAVRAFRLIQSKRPSARLLLVGAEDPLHATGLTSEETRALREDVAVIDRGWREDIVADLAISNLLLFPSRREGMPVNLMEALAMGVPVVASRARGCRDIVDDGETGLLVSDLSAESVASAAVKLLSNSVLHKFMSGNAWSRRGRFDRRLFVNAQMSAYDALSGSHTTPHPHAC